MPEMNSFDGILVDNHKTGKLLKLDVSFLNKYVLSHENPEEIYRSKLS